MRINAIHYQYDIASFRDFEGLDIEEVRKDIAIAPWHVGEIFDDTDDSYDYWHDLLLIITD